MEEIGGTFERRIIDGPIKAVPMVLLTEVDGHEEVPVSLDSLFREYEGCTVLITIQVLERPDDAKLRRPRSVRDTFHPFDR